MTLFFLISLFTGLIADYSFKKCNDEIDAHALNSIRVRASQLGTYFLFISN